MSTRILALNKSNGQLLDLMVFSAKDFETSNMMEMAGKYIFLMKSNMRHLSIAYYAVHLELFKTRYDYRPLTQSIMMMQSLVNYKLELRELQGFILEITDGITARFENFMQKHDALEFLPNFPVNLPFRCPFFASTTARRTYLLTVTQRIPHSGKFTWWYPLTTSSDPAHFHSVYPIMHGFHHILSSV